MSSATFDSVDTMERNRDQATALKIASMREAGVEELDECESWPDRHAHCQASRGR